MYDFKFILSTKAHLWILLFGFIFLTFMVDENYFIRVLTWDLNTSIGWSPPQSSEIFSFPKFIFNVSWVLIFPVVYWQLRIRGFLFPWWIIFLQSIVILLLIFANTIFTIENWGFIADLRNKEHRMVQELIAHELSHQWWGGQIRPENIEGAIVLTETLAQYTEFMVLDPNWNTYTMISISKLQLKSS